MTLSHPIRMVAASATGTTTETANKGFNMEPQAASADAAAERLTVEERFARLEARQALLDEQLAHRQERLDSIDARLEVSMGMSAEALDKTANLIAGADEQTVVVARMTTGMQTIAVVLRDITDPP